MIISFRRPTWRTRYDLVVIGGGPGGYVAAIRAAQLGMKVACVEKRPTGPRRHLPERRLHPVARRCSIPASCTTTPSTSFAKHGIKVGSVALDLAAMLAAQGQGRQATHRRRRVPVQEEQGRRPSIGTAQARWAAARSRSTATTATKTTLEAKNILLATGSEPIELPFLQFDGKHIVSSTEALTFDKVPKHLIVVGGGYIGLELGSVWKRLGAKVTVLEFLPRILPIADGEIASVVQKSLRSRGSSSTSRRR